MTVPDNLRLLREIDANCTLLLAAHKQNPRLLAFAE